MRVLLVDDDEETLEVLERALQREGHIVFSARDTHQADEWLERERLDILVLDVMLGQDSGLVFCQKLRRAGAQLPILFLSALGRANARIDGLASGGDDYLAKPFALRELLLRVRALGRRGPLTQLNQATLGQLQLDFSARRARADGEIPVTRREWEILMVLSDARGTVVPFDALLERVWGEATDSARASLEVIVSRLRKKLDRAAGQPVIRTARGLGYALEQES